MCLPVAENRFQSKPSAIPTALQDLYSARDEVVAEVRRAPERRMDNVITGLQDAVCQLKMHAVILQDIRQRWSKFYWQCKWTELGVATTGSTLAAALATYGASLGAEVTGAVIGVTVLLTGGLNWYHGSQIQEWERQAVSPEELGAAFQRTHSRAVQDGDEFVAVLWQRIRDHLSAVLQRGSSIADLENVSKADLQGLDDILNNEIPALRRQVSPSHYGKASQHSTE